jgi:phenylalanyl-tRNA synthetase beta chain
MRVSTTWLNKYLKQPLSTDEVVEALECTEVEIEEVIKPPQLDKKIVTAKVLAVLQHPNADKLKLVDIQYGKTRCAQCASRIGSCLYETRRHIA